MGGCSTYQIRKIYAIGQALGIVNRGGEDALHDLVYGVTGKSSVKELSYSEACKVIGELEARQGTPPPPAQRKPTTASESRAA
ncbi:MAG: phage protein GemA/Gp16 family protein [Subdoligranulum sp.]